MAAFMGRRQFSRIPRYREAHWRRSSPDYDPHGVTFLSTRRRNAPLVVLLMPTEAQRPRQTPNPTRERLHCKSLSVEALSGSNDHHGLLLSPQLRQTGRNQVFGLVLAGLTQQERHRALLPGEEVLPYLANRSVTF